MTSRAGRLRTRTWLLLAILAGTTRAAAAQDETKLGGEFRLEREVLAETCAALKTVTSCAMTVATGHPVHVAFGTIAPGNGVALGAAFGTDTSPNESWRINWSGDAVRTFGGSWRAGAYATFAHTPNDTITVVTAPSAAPPPDALAVHGTAVASLFLQTTSLQNVSFFGLGPNSSRADRTVFGMRQTTIGADVVAPVGADGPLRSWHPSVVAQLSGRFVDLRDGTATGVPTTGDRFTDATAPGLSAHTSFLQLGEGARLTPSFFNAHLRLNYLGLAQQFLTSSDGASSFQRYRIDLRHEIPLFGQSGASANPGNTPNDCRVSGGTSRCPAISHDRYGTVTARMLYVLSGTSGAVPFYFQPTLGGSDINGLPILASYDDYRFRAPNLLVFQESVEVSVWRMIGAWAQVEQGTVGITRGDVWSDLKRSVAMGATIRAGGFPMMRLSWATGGPEGSHVSATISTSLLGGSSRPPLD